MRWIIAALGAVMTTYALVVWNSLRFSAGQVILLVLGIPLLIYGLFYTPIRSVCTQGLGASLLFIAKMGYALVCMVIIAGSIAMGAAALKAPRQNADALIVLGAGLWGENVSPTLAARLDAAITYLQDNPQTRCVLSGGQGPDEPIPEALAMARYVEKAGIAPERLILEEQSTNTHQNILYSLEILDKDSHVVIVTSDFHVLRGTSLARGAGFTNVDGLASPSLASLLPQYALRETVGLLKDGVLGRFG